MKVQEYQHFQQDLLKNLNNHKKLHQIIQDNKNLINEIVKTMGSGNPILAKPYDFLYEKGLYEEASFYQTEIENVNGVALFGEND
jgi:hypothetical protein